MAMIVSLKLSVETAKRLGEKGGSRRADPGRASGKPMADHEAEVPGNLAIQPTSNTKRMRKGLGGVFVLLTTRAEEIFQGRARGQRQRLCRPPT